MTVSTDAITSRREVPTCRQCGWSNGNVACGPERATKTTNDYREIYIKGACDV
jgi:hypothetical protein